MQTWAGVFSTGDVMGEARKCTATDGFPCCVVGMTEDHTDFYRTLILSRDPDDVIDNFPFCPYCGRANEVSDS